MASKLPQFVIRAEKEILNKISYIADANDRSMNQEIVNTLKKHIRRYEEDNGEIKIDE